ncbi:hydroxyisourate hydrolase [Roseibium sp.]|uniref:hydroxyisourate hydrolase n=1 Tax=Roseibium sp. TaxID=1936156 RepID=UPI003A975876
MGRLTTHVLDTALGKPAAGLTIELRRLEGDGKHWKAVSSLVTNDDGRVDAPFLEGDTMTAGTYEFRFHAGDYLKASALGTLPEPLFLDVIPIRFGIADVDAHYHVPLLLSPFGYSTYRGS